MLTRPLRVAVLCSQRAPGLRSLLADQSATFELVGVIASDPGSAALADTGGTGVPCLVHDFAEFHHALDARTGNLAVRPLYDFETAQLLVPWRPELIVLCGYRHILTDPMLVKYRDRIINVHDSDLLVSEPDGRAPYRGLHSTRDAIFAGETETRATCHLVTRAVDVGPPLVRSWSFATHEMIQAGRRLGATDLLKAYAYAQREWMMRTAWPPLLKAAIERFARNEVRILNGRAFLDGSPGPVTLERPLEVRATEPQSAPVS